MLSQILSHPDIDTPSRDRVRKMSKVATKSFADKAILLESNRQLRESNKKRAWNAGDRSQLSKARVLDARVLEQLELQFYVLRGWRTANPVQPATHSGTLLDIQISQQEAFQSMKTKN